MLPQQATHTRGCRRTKQKSLVPCGWQQAGKYLLDPHSQRWQRPACTALKSEHHGDGTDTPRLWVFRSSGQRMCQEGKGDLTDKKHQNNIPWHGTKRCFPCLIPQAPSARGCHAALKLKILPWRHQSLHLPFSRAGKGALTRSGASLSRAQHASASLTSSLKSPSACTA